MNKYVERLYNGVIKENPTFVLMLGCVRHLRLHLQRSTDLVWDSLPLWYWYFPTF